jgi:hypothetical protein
LMEENIMTPIEETLELGGKKGELNVAKRWRVFKHVSLTWTP